MSFMANASFHRSVARRDLRRFPKLHVEEVMAESELRIENLSIYHARLASL